MWTGEVVPRAGKPWPASSPLVHTLDHQKLNARNCYSINTHSLDLDLDQAGQHTDMQDASSWCLALWQFSRKIAIATGNLDPGI